AGSSTASGRPGKPRPRPGVAGEAAPLRRPWLRTRVRSRGWQPGAPPKCTGVHREPVRGGRRGGGGPRSRESSEPRTHGGGAPMTKNGTPAAPLTEQEIREAIAFQWSERGLEAPGAWVRRALEGDRDTLATVHRWRRAVGRAR